MDKAVLFLSVAGDIPAGLIALLIFCVLLLVAYGVFMISRYKKCPSDKIMVIYGKVGRNPDGTPRGARCIHGGAALVWPVIQGHSFLDLNPIAIEIPAEQFLRGKRAESLAASGTDIPKSAVITVAVSTVPPVMQNAAERLIGLSAADIRMLAEDISLGQLRLLAENGFDGAAPDVWASSVAAAIEKQINKIGMTLININIW